MRKPRQERDPKRTRRLNAFLRDAFSDYVAARVLFLSKLPQQGAILSSTAIEKCIKAVMAFQGNQSHGHLKAAHWNFLKAFDKSIFARVDDDFLRLNQRAYDLRYTDDLPVDFNLVIASREFLAEMDRTVRLIFSCFSIDVGGKRTDSLYESAIKNSDNRILAENHLLAGEAKSRFIYSQPQFVYEVRNDPLRGLVEVTYEAVGPPKRDGFLRPGLVPLNKDRTEIDLAFGDPTGRHAEVA